MDHQRTDLKRNRVFVVRVEDGVLVKRAARSRREWQLVSDNPEYKPTALPRDAQVIGQVMWTGRTLR